MDAYDTRAVCCAVFVLVFVCCAATWQGRMVAVKIIEYMQEPGQKDPLEGLLSEQVQHPNVVGAANDQQVPSSAAAATVAAASERRNRDILSVTGQPAPPH